MDNFISLPEDITNEHAQGMRLGILITRIERKEDVDSYPISKFEQDSLRLMLPSLLPEKAFYKIIQSSDPYWAWFSLKHFEVNLN